MHQPYRLARIWDTNTPLPSRDVMKTKFQRSLRSTIHTAAFAGSDSFIRYLVEHGDDVNHSPKTRYTACLKCFKNHKKIVQILIYLGLNRSRMSGRLVVHYIQLVSGSRSHIAGLLEAGADLMALDYSAGIPLHDAVSKNIHLLPRQSMNSQSTCHG
jgi:hypothetical protein